MPDFDLTQVTKLLGDKNLKSKFIMFVIGRCVADLSKNLYAKRHADIVSCHQIPYKTIRIPNYDLEECLRGIAAQNVFVSMETNKSLPVTIS